MMLSNLCIASATSRWSISQRSFATGALSALALATTACGCETSILLRVDPRTTTLRVGQSFTPVATDASPCRDKNRSEAWSWRTPDAAVVRVDSATGRTTGLAAGTATVQGLTSLNVISTDPVVGIVTVTVTVVP